MILQIQRIFSDPEYWQYLLRIAGILQAFFHLQALNFSV